MNLHSFLRSNRTVLQCSNVAGFRQLCLPGEPGHEVYQTFREPEVCPPVGECPCQGGSALEGASLSEFHTEGIFPGLSGRERGIQMSFQKKLLKMQS